MAFKFEGKETYPIFVFAKCCWSIHSKVARLWQERAEQTENGHSHTAVSRQVYVHALLVQHLHTRYIFSTYGLVWSNIRNSFNAEKAKNLIKIYRFYRAEEDNQ